MYFLFVRTHQRCSNAPHISKTTSSKCLQNNKSRLNEQIKASKSTNKIFQINKQRHWNQQIKASKSTDISLFKRLYLFIWRLFICFEAMPVPGSSNLNCSESTRQIVMKCLKKPWMYQENCPISNCYLTSRIQIFVVAKLTSSGPPVARAP